MTACCPTGIPHFRTGLISLGLVTLCAAGFLGGDGGPGTPAAATSRAVDPAVLFPAGTVLMMSFDGGPCAEHGKELGISKIWNEPEMQDFVKETVELLNEKIDTNVKGFVKAIGLSTEDLEAYGRSKVALAVTHFAMPEGGMMSGPPEFDAMLAMDLKGRPQGVEAALKALEQQMGAGEAGAFKDATVAGVAAKVIPVPEGGPFDGVTYLVHDGWLIAATSQKELEAAVTRAKGGDKAGSLASDPKFAAAMKNVARPKTVFSFFMTYGWLLNIMSEADPSMKEMMSATGLEGLTDVAYGLDLDGSSVRERMFASVKPDTKMAKLQVPMDVSGILGRVPKRSIAAFVNSINLKETLGYVTASLKENPLIGDEIDTFFEKVDEVLGAGWREELLPNLGPEVAAFVAMPKFGFVPEIGVLVKIGDKAKVETAIDRALEKVKAKGATTSVKFLDATIHSVNLGELKIDKDLNMRPAYVFTEGYLLLTPSTHTAKNLLISMNNKDGGLAARDEFSKAFGRLKSESAGAGSLGIGFVDLQWVAGFLLDSGIPVAQSAVPSNELKKLGPVSLDLSKAPSTESVTRHVGPILFQSEMRDGGTYTEIVSPTGMIPLMIGAGAAAGAVMAVSTEAASDEDAVPQRADPAEREQRHRVRPPKPMPTSRPSDKDEDK